MNRCVSFNEGTAIRGDNAYSITKEGVNSFTKKWEGPSEETKEFEGN